MWALENGLGALCTENLGMWSIVWKVLGVWAGEAWTPHCKVHSQKRAREKPSKHRAQGRGYSTWAQGQ